MAHATNEGPTASSETRIQPSAPPDEGELAGVLARALSVQLDEEATRLGLALAPGASAWASRHLLGEPLADGGRGDDSGWIAEGEMAGPRFADDFEIHDYLHLVSQEMRKQRGQFMTPRPIVRYILRAVGYHERAGLLDSTLGDPACGSGIFLVEAVKVYLGALRNAGVPPEAWYPHVRERFFGVDIDPVACLYARFNLSLLLAPALLLWMEAHSDRALAPLRIHSRDTLGAMAGELRGCDLFAYGEEGLTLRETCDFVVGNPPYHKIGDLAPELREAFAASVYGHPNAYGLFLHAGLEMLRPGGRLAYIVPRSMLSGLYFQNLRRFLEERSRLEELTLLAERRNVFDQVLQGTMVLVLERPEGAAASGGSPIRTGVVRSADELETRAPAHVTVRQDRVSRALNGTRIWFVSDRARTYSLLDKLLGAHPLLASPAVACPARTGPIVWNRVKPWLRTRREAGARPLVWATDVGRFRFDFASAGEARPAYLQVTERTRGLLLSGPVLLAQRVTAEEQPHRLVACLPAKFCARHAAYFVENHVNVLQPAAAAPPIALEYLLGVLSSEVIEFLFRAMNGNTQVSATELNLMPVPRGRLEREIAALAAELQEEGDPGTRAGFEGELNEKVAWTYGLTARDLAFLRARLVESRPDRDAR